MQQPRPARARLRDAAAQSSTAHPMRAVTVVEHAPEGERRIAIARDGQFEVTRGGERVLSGHIAPDIHARITSQVERLGLFRSVAFGTGAGDPVEVRFLAGEAVRSVRFNASGRAPDAAWDLLEMTTEVSGPGFWGARRPVEAAEPAATSAQPAPEPAATPAPAAPAPPTEPEAGGFGF